MEKPNGKNHRLLNTSENFPSTHGQSTQVAELFSKEWRWAYFHLNEQEVFKVASSPAEWVSDDAPSNIIKMRKTHSPFFHQSISHPPQMVLGDILGGGLHNLLDFLSRLHSNSLINATQKWTMRISQGCLNPCLWLHVTQPIALRDFRDRRRARKAG